jgi:hypothetical protein
MKCYVSQPTEVEGLSAAGWRVLQFDVRGRTHARCTCCRDAPTAPLPLHSKAPLTLCPPGCYPACGLQMSKVHGVALATRAKASPRGPPAP